MMVIQVLMFDQNFLKKKSPLHVYAFEANLDLMSYFELHREKFKSGNFLLISMEGRKEKVLSKAILMAFSRTQDVLRRAKNLKPSSNLSIVPQTDFLKKN
ncbi:hypothetical protein ACN9TI_14440 [Lactococcus lactis]